MTTIYLWIKNNLSIGDFDVQPEKNRWMPNNLLYRNNLIQLHYKSELARQGNSLENILIPKSKRLIKEFMLVNKSCNYESKYKIKNQMAMLDKEITFIENNIKLLNEKINSNDKYNDYYESAVIFIEKNNLKFLKPENILSDDSIIMLIQKQLIKYYETNDVNIISELKLISIYLTIEQEDKLNLFSYDYVNKKLLLKCKELDICNVLFNVFLFPITDYCINESNVPLEITDYNVEHLISE
jgi:hypothetical protein